MLISSYAVKEAMSRYNKGKRKEAYSGMDSAAAGAEAAFASFLVILSILFFLAELLVLFYAINSAMTCSQGGPERLVNIILATTFTLPYMLLNSLFNACTKSTLRQDVWVPEGSPLVARQEI